MHRVYGLYGLSAICFADGLMAEANAEKRDCFAEPFNDLDASARLGWGARAGGDDYSLRGYLLYVVHCNGVVTDDCAGCAKALYVSCEVVDKGVVVINNQNHDFWTIRAPIFYWKVFYF